MRRSSHGASAAPDVARERPAEDHERDHHEDLQRRRALRVAAGAHAVRRCNRAQAEQRVRGTPRAGSRRRTAARTRAAAARARRTARAERPSVSASSRQRSGARAVASGRCSSLACDKAVNVPREAKGTACYGGENDHSNERRASTIRSGKEAPMSYVDLHLHLLPGVDDGAQDEAASLAHARRLAAEGVRDVTVTPHVNGCWPLEIAIDPGARRRARRRARASTGSASACGPAASSTRARARTLADDELELIAHGPAEQPLAARRGAVPRHRRGVRRRLSRRSPPAASAPSSRTPSAPPAPASPAASGRCASLLEAGAVAQVNVCSLLGNNGLRVQETAVTLLRSGLAYVIASDGHPGTREHTRGARLRARAARRRLVGAGLAADPGQPALPAHARDPRRRRRRRRSTSRRARDRLTARASG